MYPRFWSVLIRTISVPELHSLWVSRPWCQQPQEMAQRARPSWRSWTVVQRRKVSIRTITARPERVTAAAAAGLQPADTISRSHTHSPSSQSHPLFFWICRAKSQKEIDGLSDSHSCPLQTNSPSPQVMSANYIKAPSERQLLETHLNQDLKPAARKEKSHLNMLCTDQWASLWFLHTYIINVYLCKHRF